VAVNILQLPGGSIADGRHTSIF